MADVQVAPEVGVTPTHVVRRRRGLPGTRAVVGALLVVLAAVGTFAAYLTATAPPTTGFLVAAHQIDPGATLTAADLDVVYVSLDGAQAATVLREQQRGDVIGTVAAVPIARGALLLGSMVQHADALGGELFSFSLPDDQALGGGLRPPTRVDLLATYGTGADAETIYLVRSVEVLSTAANAGSLGGGSTLFTVVLPDPAAVQRLAHALGNAQVWLARSGSGTTIPATYTFTGR